MANSAAEAHATCRRLLMKARSLAFVGAMLAPEAAWAHGPASLQYLITWDFVLICAGLIYLAAGPKPLRARLAAIALGVIAAVIGFLATASFDLKDENSLAAAATLDGIAPLIGFFLGRPLVRYLGL